MTLEEILYNDNITIPMNPTIIKRIILKELFPLIPMSEQITINLNRSLRNQSFWHIPVAIKRLSKIEQILNLPPIPFRLYYNKPYFHYTPQDILDNINCIRPQHTTHRQITDNLKLINIEMGKNHQYGTNYKHYFLDKEYQKHIRYLDAINTTPLCT